VPSANSACGACVLPDLPREGRGFGVVSETRDLDVSETRDFDVSRGVRGMDQIYGVGSGAGQLVRGGGPEVADIGQRTSRASRPGDASALSYACARPCARERFMSGRGERR
jgi:hypothetical protein